LETPVGIAVLVLAYLAGSIPVGVVVGKLLRGTDLRSFGSGSTGTTNALRAYGPKISALVLICDILKGAIPVFIAYSFDRSPWFVGAVAVLAVVGHCWSPFIEFDGGKGVATGAGALIALQPWVAFAILLMVAIVVLTHYVSLGSIVTAVSIGIALSVAALWDREPPAIAIAALMIAAIIVWRHRGNIDRLLHGSERRISFRNRVTA
jgi:acyl phosphate:glycerol-3-phosphate acyltransferase